MRVILVSDFHYNVSMTSTQRRLNDGPQNITMSAWQTDSTDSMMGQRTLQCQPDKHTAQTQWWATEHYNVSLTSTQHRLNDGPEKFTMSAWHAHSADSMMGQRTLQCQPDTHTAQTQWWATEHYNVSLTSTQCRLNDGPENITMSAWQAHSADSMMGHRTLQCQPDKHTAQTQWWAREHYNVSLTSTQRRLNDGPENITMSAWQTDSADSMMGQRTLQCQPDKQTAQTQWWAREQMPVSSAKPG